ncbi:hypothetical protein [Streptosporangium pseudovulgare]|uniref:Uncharacterized protein n=1 Tax=Streptosporangium pseudovulgare TaxID=35765 RepID=A0ABQ2QUP0_9ACTN|nr:hypothetical protein [Streptosporangium pseudovulgare]GGP96962.1 hypothetical protein GCM10010140_28620 [Streptosporangium pseudovulgare]
MPIPCLACDAPFRPDEYFPACHDYDRRADLVSWTCPRCGNRDELRVFTGELVYGHARRGGFDAEDRLPVPGLRRRRHDARLDITLDGTTWRVPARARRPAKAPGPPRGL